VYNACVFVSVSASLHDVLSLAFSLAHIFAVCFVRTQTWSPDRLRQPPFPLFKSSARAQHRGEPQAARGPKMTHFYPRTSLTRRSFFFVFACTFMYEAECSFVFFCSSLSFPRFIVSRYTLLEFRLWCSVPALVPAAPCTPSLLLLRSFFFLFQPIHLLTMYSKSLLVCL
jgi:hypothetical protein